MLTPDYKQKLKNIDAKLKRYKKLQEQQEQALETSKRKLQAAIDRGESRLAIYEVDVAIANNDLQNIKAKILIEQSEKLKLVQQKRVDAQESNGPELM